MLRGCVVLVGLLAVAMPAVAGEMSPEEARRFVVGKTFAYRCFEGTRGQGRVLADGSVVGSVQFQGRGRVHHAALPPGTLRVQGGAVCASLRGLPIQPCFSLQRVDRDSFRGSISGLSFAYCRFNERHERVAQSASDGPLALRPTLAAEE